MNIGKYCKLKGMNKEEYQNFKSNMTATAEAIRSTLNYRGGMYYSTNEFLKWDGDKEINCIIINILKTLGIEFCENDTMYRVCN